MERDNIRTTAQNYLSDITEVKENIFRGEYKINNSAPAGIFFVDVTDNIPFENFADYQEKLLADEYYNHPGSQQWNYYLLMLQESIDPEIKNRIEKNDKYARKYILNEKEFTDFFTLESSSQVTSGNIVLEWKKQLNEVGLHEVYSKASYTDSVWKFINKPSPVVPQITAPASGSQMRFDFINKIKLNSTYREYPKQRVFEFGKVNLFYGINGVGKTSLLEAIELIACGRTLRNYDIVEKDGCIEAVINSNFIKTEICTPSKNEKYRANDKFWYNNDYNQKNYTYESFGRFNFFNTDAAYALANSNSDKEVKESLLSLVLGPEYNYIIERVNGFYMRIRPEYNKLDEGLNEARAKVKSATVTMTRLRNDTSIQARKDALLRDISSLAFKNPNIFPGDDTTIVEEECNRLSALLDIFLNGKLTFVTNYKSLLERKENINGKRRLFEDYLASATRLET